MNRLLMVAAVLALAACTKESAPPAAAAAPAPVPAVSADDRPVIVAFGDSLSAGHGVDAGRSYPDVLQKELDARGYRYRVVNLGISGDTTAGGLSRIDTALRLKPAIVILELGGNDGLRGLPIEQTRSNLARMTEAFQDAGARVVLAGLTLPANYGHDYVRKFELIYPELAGSRHAALIPFLLDGVALVPGMMQPDGIHPTVEGHRRVAANVLKTLAPLLRK